MKIRLQVDSSIAIVFAEDDDAREWIHEFVSETGFQPGFPNSLVVEHRFLEPLVAGFKEAGGEVK